jgi:8-oxo-dGTP pyrophosphatase MutT (NUDIX family)
MKELFEAMEGLKDNRNGKVVTFDFDNTIVKSFLNKTTDGEEHYMFGGVNEEIIKRIKKFKDSGTTVFIVTSRRNDLEADESSVKVLIKQLGIEVDAVFYTNGELKAQKLYELGSRLHYDDDPKEREAIEAFKNLHKDFEITVKDPNDLIKDIDAISKGVIITSDYKFIIAERSDSYEWDAPGGHLMAGEEANYAFWREVKEELGLEVQEVTFLDRIDTTWKGETKDTYYFFGRIDYSSEELEGVIDLQWEVSDYFCGTYDEILQKVGQNGTQHFDNVMQRIESQQEMIESYQPHSKNHAIKKRRIIGLGGSKTTGAKGLKRVRDFSRAKSAPPGFGVLEEENVEKPTKKLKIKIKTELDEKKRKKKKKTTKKKGSSKRKSKKRKGSSWGIYGGAYYDWGMYDGSDGGGDGGGGE